MSRKVILMYGLFLGWGEILIDRIFAEQYLDIKKVLLIFTPLIIIAFLVIKWKKIKIDRLYILENTAVCIALMLIYSFLYKILPDSVKYFVVIILLASIGFMTLTMFASFRHFSPGILTAAEGIRYAAVILFVNTAVTMLYKIIAQYNISLLEGIILFFILCLYYLYFFNTKDRKPALVSRINIPTPRKTLLFVVAFMFLLSIGYGPFLNSLRREFINTYTYAFVYVRLVYLLSLTITYVCIEKFKDYLDIIMMFFLALIVIAHLLASFIKSQTAVFVLTIIIQYAYPVLHTFLGGLLIMLGYMFYDTYHNMFILTMTAFVSMIAGIMLPALIVGQTLLNILFTLILSVVAMVLVMFMRQHVFKEFNGAAAILENEKNKLEQLEKLGNYSALTPREKEVLEYLISDYTNRYIAEKLKISENTLKKHAKSIYEKLKISSKKELKKLVGEHDGTFTDMASTVWKEG